VLMYTPIQCIEKLKHIRQCDFVVFSRLEVTRNNAQYIMSIHDIHIPQHVLTDISNVNQFLTITNRCQVYGQVGAFL